MVRSVRGKQVQGFLNGQGSHDSGITLASMLNMSSDEFEDRHDLIQWLFPTMNPSLAQPQSPFLTWEDTQEIRIDVLANVGLAEALDYYQMFLQERPDIWLVGTDHNHLRITRMIESRSLFRGQSGAKTALAFVSKLNANAGWPVNIKSTEFWKDAVWYGDKRAAEQKDY